MILKSIPSFRGLYTKSIPLGFTKILSLSSLYNKSSMLYSLFTFSTVTKKLDIDQILTKISQNYRQNFLTKQYLQFINQNLTELASNSQYPQILTIFQSYNKKISQKHEGGQKNLSYLQTLQSMIILANSLKYYNWIIKILLEFKNVENKAKIKEKQLQIKQVQQQVSIQILLGYNYYKINNYEEAKIWYIKSLQKLSQKPQIVEYQTHIRSILLEIYARLKDYPRALEQARILIQKIQAKTIPFVSSPHKIYIVLQGCILEYRHGNKQKLKSFIKLLQAQIDDNKEQAYQMYKISASLSKKFDMRSEMKESLQKSMRLRQKYERFDQQYQQVLQTLLKIYKQDKDDEWYEMTRKQFAYTCRKKDHRYNFYALKSITVNPPTKMKLFYNLVTEEDIFHTMKQKLKAFESSYNIDEKYKLDGTNFNGIMLKYTLNKLYSRLKQIQSRIIFKQLQWKYTDMVFKN